MFNLTYALDKQTRAGVKHLTIPKFSTPVMQWIQSFPLLLVQLSHVRRATETGEKAKTVAITSAMGCEICQAQEANDGTGIKAEDYEV